MLESIAYAVLLAWTRAPRCQADESDRPAALEWNQPRGNAAGTCALEVAPLESEPVLAWKVPLESLVCAPVTWAGVLYGVDGDGRKRKLRAWRIEDGEALGTATLPDEGETWLAAWSGTVAVVTNKSTALFQHRGTRLSRKEGLAMGALAPPSVYGGWLFLPGAARLHALELGTGTLQELCTSGPFRAALGPGQSPGSARLANARTAGGNGTDEYLALDVRELVGLASKKLVPGTATMHSGSTFHHSLRTEKPGYVVDLGSHWFVLSPQALRTTAEPCHAALIPLGRLAPLVGDVTARERTVFGLSSKGEWLAVNNEGAFRAVLAPGQTPLGSQVRRGEHGASRALPRQLGGRHGGRARAVVLA